MHHLMVCLVCHLQHSPPTNWPTPVKGLVDWISHAMCSQGVQGELKVIRQGCAVSLVTSVTGRIRMLPKVQQRAGASHGPGPPVLLEWRRGTENHDILSAVSAVWSWWYFMIFRISGACIFWGQHSNETCAQFGLSHWCRWWWLSQSTSQSLVELSRMIWVALYAPKTRSTMIHYQEWHSCILLYQGNDLPHGGSWPKESKGLVMTGLLLPVYTPLTRVDAEALAFHLTLLRDWSWYATVTRLVYECNTLLILRQHRKNVNNNNIITPYKK